jgi:hypothetical protein
VDAEINPQKDLLETNTNDKWQVFIDLVGSTPIPNIRCRWLIYGTCVKICFDNASQGQLDETQTSAVRAWMANTPLCQLHAADALPPTSDPPETKTMEP